MLIDKYSGIACIIAAGCAVLGAGAHRSMAEGPSRPKFLNASNTTTNEGHVALRWQADDGIEFELQQSENPQFSDPIQLYVGADSSSFLSGLTDGRYFFRVRARNAPDGAWGAWSTPIELACQHHTMSLAWLLFAAGGLLFLSIAMFVGINAMRLRRFEAGHA